MKAQHTTALTAKRAALDAPEASGARDASGVTGVVAHDRTGVALTLRPLARAGAEGEGAGQALLFFSAEGGGDESRFSGGEGARWPQASIKNTYTP